MHYLHLANPVDVNVVKTLIDDQGVDVMKVGNQAHTAAIVAAKNPKCTMATLNFLADKGVELNKQCETQATVLMYYVRYAEVIDPEVVKML